MAFFAYFAHRQTRPTADRPVRLPGFMRWVALAIGIFCAVLWAFGGWNSPSIVVGTPSHSLFFVGVVVLAAYVPLHLWRRMSDRRALATSAVPAPAPVASEPELA